MRRLHHVILIILFFIAFSASFTPARAADATVTDCTNFVGAGTISQAVTDANAGGGTITFACSGTIIFANALVITDVVTINADGNSVIFDGNNSVTLFAIGGGTLTLDGFTLQDGNSIGFGGAIQNAVGNLIIMNSTFTANIADRGGAIFNAGGSNLTISNSTFTGNMAMLFGGAINNNGTLTISDSTFSGNSASEGGAINNNGTLTITNSTFSNNTATNGGAIYNTGTASSQDSNYVNNTCTENPITDNGGNTVINATGCPGTTPVIPPVISVSAPVTVVGCALDVADGLDIFNAPDNTYCRILMKNGGVTDFSGAIPAELINLGVILAVDVYRLEGGASVNTFPNYARVCLAGDGRLFYMDSRQAPRVAIELATENVDGLTCGWIPAPGTVILTN